jgi:ABC-2 type transport system permease protein
VRKEWGEVFRQKMVLFSTLFMPLMLTAIPLATLYFSRADGGAGAMAELGDLGDMADQFAAACEGLTAAGCAQFIILQQFLALFLLVPAIIPVTIASYSIVGEKSARTLEPLLATPITTTQLLAGKALAAAIPGVLATFLSFGIFVTGAIFLSIDPALPAKLFSPIWVLGIFTVGPLLAIAGVSLAVMISSRMNDPRAAEQISVLFMMPVMGIFLGQVTGSLIVNTDFMLVLAAALVLADALLLFFATQLFERENILTRWK